MYEDWSERCRRWAGIRSEWIDVDGVRVHVLRTDGADPQGTPQLLIHGLGGCATNWIEVICDLAAHGPVVAPDLPGFGRTEPTEPGRVRVPDNAEFLQLLLDELGWDEAVVHGNSMGGMLAVHLAGLAPERVARLVLAAPAFPTPPTALHRVPPTTLARFAPFALPGLGRFAMRLLSSAVSPERYFQEAARFIHADPDRVTPEARAVGLEDVSLGRDAPWRVAAFTAAAESVVRSMLAPGDLLKLIDDAAMPVLVVWGDADRLISRTAIDHVMKRQPTWDLEVLPSVGHVPMLEAPADYVAAVDDWLQVATPTALAA
ncbi:alpha/beta fold hydrolase [Egicoccus sp. AB-alg2]|uniref:alpha/beta fold hydrolase n=1 Tax=Egicoccus sp. AB-alg2 TaxID=3242693 RepID=UPI00359CE3DD